MNRSENLNLQRYNTFGVRAAARQAVQIDREEDLPPLEFNPNEDLVLGGGSNLLLAADVPGTVFLNRIPGMRIEQESAGGVTVHAGGGELWHSLVLWSLTQGLCGLENLSLIPGRVGAAPMQNIGAYGVELAEVLESVQAWDWRERRMVRFDNAECHFGYRTSRFKTTDRNRYLVTSIRLKLSRRFQPRLSYAGLTEQLEDLGIAQPGASDVSRAVIQLRKRKLPDPALLGNAGSFFKNPVIAAQRAESLRARFQGLPVYPYQSGQVKLSAAWMIEHCGWKGHREGDAGVSQRHALVLVNHGAASGAQILALARKVAASVRDQFGIDIEPEPVIIGDTDRHP